jgi:hypothetical protein
MIRTISLQNIQGKRTNQALLNSLLDLLDLDLTEALDFQECPAGGTVDGLNRKSSVLMSIALFQEAWCMNLTATV